MSKAIDDLKHEHEAILSALQIVNSMTARIGKGTSIDAQDMRDFTDFLKEFADKCHHGKEEGLLFPALTRAGIPEKNGPIGVLLSEHTEGRKLIKDMQDALSPEVNYSRFAQSAGRYSNLMRNHIQKENDVLFPAAEKSLTDTQLLELYDNFQRHEEEVIGEGKHEELHAMLKNLKKKYPA